MSNNTMLWPDDLVASTDITPADILKEQADDLGTKTGHILEAEVTAASQGEYLALDFRIIAPTLDNYMYRLFTVRHKLDLYPSLEIILSADDIRNVSTQEAFYDELKAIFSSKETRNIIGELLAYSKKGLNPD